MNGYELACKLNELRAHSVDAKEALDSSQGRYPRALLSRGLELLETQE